MDLLTFPRKGEKGRQTLEHTHRIKPLPPVAMPRYRQASNPVNGRQRADRNSVRQILRGPRLQSRQAIGERNVTHRQEAGVAGRIIQTTQPMVQRSEDPESPSEALPSPSQSPPGRAPKPNEFAELGVTEYNFPKLTEYWILREPTYGFNCFAWAVGIESRSITTNTIMGLNYSTNLDGWSRYLKREHGFKRHVDGGDVTADLVLFGEGEGAIWHAAKKAEQSFGRMTFSSKLGDGGKTPVILHALLDIEGPTYGKALRSFWQASDSTKGR